MGLSEVEIILIGTSFHLKQLRALYELSNFEARDIIVVHPSNLKQTEFSFLGPAKFLEYDPNDIKLEHVSINKRILDLVRRPISAFRKYRKIVKNCTDLVCRFSGDLDIASQVKLIIFNDHDLLTQIAMRFVKKRISNVKIVAIDEGLGYYVLEGFKDKIMRFIYKLTSPLIFGFNYLYLEQYGTHPMINEVYLRFPNQLLIRSKHVEYKTIPVLSSEQKVHNPVKRPTLLFFSTLFSEENYISIVQERELYIYLTSELLREGISLVWKPHPRENKLKIRDLDKLLRKSLGHNYYRLETDLDIELMDINSFDCIFNIGSTVLLYILEQEFPPDRVLNLKLYNFDLQATNQVRSIAFTDYKKFIPVILRGLQEKPSL